MDRVKRKVDDVKKTLDDVRTRCEERYGDAREGGCVGVRNNIASL